MRKSVGKLKKKESVYKKGSYRDDHHCVQTSTKFFYIKKKKKTKNECTLRNGCIIKCPNDLTVDLKLYLGRLGFLISTHVLHLNILMNHEYSRMLQLLLNLQCTSFYMLKFHLASRFGGIKQKKGIFLLFLKLFRFVLCL